MKHFTILSLIFFGIVSRLMPHPPNFTATDAIAILGISALGNVWLAALTVFSSLFLTDIVLGFYPEIHFTYISYAIIIVLGHWYSKSSTSRNIILLATSALIFFLIANFGSWLNSSLYPKTFYGLGCCYLAALPFLINQMIGNIFYSVIILSFNALFLPKKALDS